jgi:hypothetical protein
MPRAKPYTVTLDPGDAMKVPAQLSAAEKRMLKQAAEGMAKTIGQFSESRQIAARTSSRVTSPHQAVIVVGAGVPFARIHDVGGTIKPKKAKALRFADGEFRPRAKRVGIRYTDRAIAMWPQHVDLAFQGSFSRLGSATNYGTFQLPFSSSIAEPWM